MDRIALTMSLYLSLTGKRRGGPRTKELIRVYVERCDAHSIDPLKFLQFRHDMATRLGHPLSVRSLISDNLVKMWERWGEGRFLEQERDTGIVAKAGASRTQAIKALRILTDGQEQAKYHHNKSMTHELCFAETDLTGGFHPASRYCPTCPFAVRCAAKLYQQHGFDVVALRAGRLYLLPPDVAAAAVG